MSVLSNKKRLESFFFLMLLKIQVKFFLTCCFMSCFQVHMSEKRKSARKEVGPVRWVML